MSTTSSAPIDPIVATSGVDVSTSPPLTSGDVSLTKTGIVNPLFARTTQPPAPVISQVLPFPPLPPLSDSDKKEAERRAEEHYQSLLAEARLKAPMITPEMAEQQRKRANEANPSTGVIPELGVVSASIGSAQRKMQQDARNRVNAAVNANYNGISTPFMSTDPFSRPKVQDVLTFSYEPMSPNVATSEQIEMIKIECLRAGVPELTVTQALWDMARYCADVGSSEFTEFLGTSTYAGKVKRMEIAAIIGKHTLIRRFCRFYAKIVWNILLASKIPPSGWLQKGYKENTKFAAFDFFSSVMDNAALEPENGLIRRPFHEEIVASQTNKGTALHRVESGQDKSASTFHEITGGRSGPRARLLLKGKEME
ncbi:coat protein [Cherry virus B]|uniref:Capsid protein n=1 Tax=Cherry virus B TaxID=2108357 RepID=A0AAD1CS18_9VIRU|nr:coat protein [Cherry virus B]BBD14453.1 coat protein [Cherry virus B]